MLGAPFASMLMPNIKRYMTREPYSIGSCDSLAKAKTLMATRIIRHLPVVDDDELVGIISDRDVAVVEAVPGVELANVEVARIMEPPLTAWSEQDIDEVSSLMADKKRDCVVVYSGQGIAGIFTATDALQALADVVRRATA